VSNSDELCTIKYGNSQWIICPGTANSTYLYSR